MNRFKPNMKQSAENQYRNDVKHYLAYPAPVTKIQVPGYKYRVKMRKPKYFRTPAHGFGG